MNLNEETRRGYTISKEMKEVWAIQLQLLKKLLEVCEKYDLKIIASGGTMLGAIREKGYIPWDDDIDMDMLRSDYDKLVSVAKEEFQDPYFFQCWQTEEKYPGGHAQLRMNGTTAILKNDNRNINQGIFIDIFVFDAIPTDKDKLKKLKERTSNIKRKLTNYSHLDWTLSRGQGTKEILDWMHVRFVGYKKFSERLDNIYRETKLEDAEEVSCIAFNWFQFDKIRRSKHIMDDILWLPFEDITIPVSSMYHTLLTNQYGNYMEPVMGGSLHGGYEILSANRPYTLFLAEVHKKRRKEVLKRKTKKLFNLLFRFKN